jgi:hypothetical protein
MKRFDLARHTFDDEVLGFHGRIESFYDIDGDETADPSFAVCAVVHLNEGKWVAVAIVTGDFPE